MKYSRLIKKILLPLSLLGLLLDPKPSKSAEWSENPGMVSCSTGHQDMSDAAVGSSHSKPFSITSSETNPHKSCLGTPEGYEITLFKIGMCTINPFDETNDNVDLAFTTDNGCVWTMESVSGAVVDLAANLNQSISLPSSTTRPPSGTYKHFLIVMNPNIKLKGSYTTTDSTNGGTFYTKPGATVDTDGEFDKSLSSAQFFTSEFDSSLGFNTRGSCSYSYQRTVSSGSNQGVVRAVLTNDLLNTQTSCSGVTKLVGAFKATTPLTIDNDTNGLEIQFSISGAGLMIEGGGNSTRGLTNQPYFGNSGDFVPVFTKF